MNTDGRALNDDELNSIQRDIFAGLYNDHDLDRMFTTIRLQRKVLQEIFKQFHAEPMRLISTAEPVRNSVLNHWKELVALESRA